MSENASMSSSMVRDAIGPHELDTLDLMILQTFLQKGREIYGLVLGFLGGIDSYV